MEYAAMTFWMLVIIFAALGVHHLWSSLIQPKVVNSILLPGTLIATLGHIFGLHLETYVPYGARAFHSKPYQVIRKDLSFEHFGGQVFGARTFFRVSKALSNAFELLFGSLQIL